MDQVNLTAAIEIQAGGPGSGCRGDDCGRPSTGQASKGKVRVFYHGTTEKAGRLIARRGLVPGKKSAWGRLTKKVHGKGWVHLTPSALAAHDFGFQNASQSSPAYLRNAKREAKEEGVSLKEYLSEDNFAGWGEYPGTKYAVVRVEIPEKEYQQMKMQADPEDRKDRRYRGKIPASYVTNVSIYKSGKADYHDATETASPKGSSLDKMLFPRGQRW